MNPPSEGNADSEWWDGPDIPGAPGMPAFSVLGAEPSAIPVLIAVPHAGRSYPAPLTDRMRDPQLVSMRLADRFADKLAREVQRETGATILVAHAPRALIDLNRAPDDVDWDMIVRTGAGQTSPHAPGRRWRSGLGLIPRRLPGAGEIWKRRADEHELAARIAGVHEPYHAALGALLTALRDRWGAALLLDLHSMPPLPAPPGTKPAEFVIGDRFGATCDGRLVASCFGYFAAAERGVAHNRPYAGDYVLHRHGTPGSGIHAVQLEIDRRSYLDSRMDQPGEGFAETAAVLTGLVRTLGDMVAEMGREGVQIRWAEAAE